MATFVKVPFAGAVTVKVTLVPAPFARLPKLHDTLPAAATPPPVALIKTTPLGKLSVTTTLLAPDGPRFVTEIV